MRRVFVSAGALLVPAIVIVIRTPTDRVAVAIAVGLISVACGAIAAAWRRPGFLGTAALTLGSEYAISLASNGREIDPFAPVVALLIYGAVEVASLEIDRAAVRTTRPRDDTSPWRTRPCRARRLDRLSYRYGRCRPVVVGGNDHPRRWRGFCGRGRRAPRRPPETDARTGGEEHLMTRFDALTGGLHADSRSTQQYVASAAPHP